MWDRSDYADPREMRAFMEHLAREVSAMRRDMDKALRALHEAEMVRRRLDYERPGYWDDSIRLEQVKRAFNQAK